MLPQLIYVLQERPQFLFDLLRFFAGPKKPEKHIISVANISEAMIGRIMWIARWELLSLSEQGFGLSILPLSSCPAQSFLASSVGRIFLANLTSRILRDQVGFHKVVELVQVDIAENGRDCASHYPDGRDHRLGRYPY